MGNQPGVDIGKPISLPILKRGRTYTIQMIRSPFFKNGLFFIIIRLFRDLISNKRLSSNSKKGKGEKIRIKTGFQKKMKRKILKRAVALTAVGALSLACLAGCDNGNKAAKEETTKTNPVEEKELVVFAAASMTETLNEIKELYEAENPGVELVYTFDSSGTLKTQIEEGAYCDIFISAAQKQMDQIDITADAEKNPDGLDFVLQGTRLNLLENKVVLVVPEGNPAGINSFDDLANALNAGNIKMAMGNEDVPVGQYTQKIFAYYGLDEATLAANGVLTYGSNVKEVTTQVSENLVDCGVIYATDAFSAGLTSVDNATKEMCGQVIYPAAVLNISENQDSAKDYLNFLQTDECKAIFEKVGFTAL